MSVTVSVITNRNIEFKHPAEVAERGAEVKEYTKTLPGSNYAIDRRD